MNVYALFAVLSDLVLMHTSPAACGKHSLCTLLRSWFALAFALRPHRRRVPLKRCARPHLLLRCVRRRRAADRRLRPRLRSARAHVRFDAVGRLCGARLGGGRLLPTRARCGAQPDSLFGRRRRRAAQGGHAGQATARARAED
eukprot:54969-Pleurochrysis_carterae.AAC.3